MTHNFKKLSKADDSVLSKNIKNSSAKFDIPKWNLQFHFGGCQYCSILKSFKLMTCAFSFP